MSFYTTDEATEKLGINKYVLAQLRTQRIIPFIRNEKTLLYPCDFVDGLAATQKQLPHSLEMDFVIYRLYFLEYSYSKCPQGLDGEQRRKYYAPFKRMCQELKVAGRICNIHKLTRTLNLRPSRVLSWITNGKILTFKTGRLRYISTKQYDHFVMVWMTHETIAEAASRHYVNMAKISHLIRQGRLQAQFCPDGMYRMEPAAVDAALQPLEEGLTVQEVSAMTGIPAADLYHRLRRGCIESTGTRRQRRIPTQEVERLVLRRNNFQPEFAWLQNYVNRQQPSQLLSRKQAARQLGVSTNALTLWARENLLPYFDAAVGNKTIYEFSRLYIFGLRRYASGNRVTKKDAVAYAQKCKEAEMVV